MSCAAPQPLSSAAVEDAVISQVAFLDDDHVVRCSRLLLDGGLGRAEDRTWLGAFFFPEPLDLGRIASISKGITVEEGAKVMAPGVSAAEANVLIFRRGVISQELLDQLPNLQLVQRLGRSARSIDLAAARQRGIEVACLRRPTLDAVAEHVFMSILALVKRLRFAERAVCEWAGSDGDAVDGTRYNWAGLQGVKQIRGATLGVVGLGEVGLSVAELAEAFGMRVLYTSRSPRGDEVPFAARVDLPTLLSQADVVSLHIPGATGAQLMDRRAFELMKPGAFFVNTARGNLVDEDALYEMLESGRLAGAALDVHAVEPRVAGDRFCKLDSVILTPHVASGSSRAGVLDEMEAMFDNIRAVISGSPPPHGRVAGK